MSVNTTHKYWYLFTYSCGNIHDSFYIAVPMVDKDAQQLIVRVRSAFRCALFNASIDHVSAQNAYMDLRDNMPVRSFPFALHIFHEILDDYYTPDALDLIFKGY